MLRFDTTTLCKPLIARERKFYESKLPKELTPFVPQFRGILEVRIVDEQDGFLCLEGHKIFGSTSVLDYHRNQCQFPNNSRIVPKTVASASAQILPAKSSSRSRSSTAVPSAAANGENVEKPPRYRFRRSGSTEIPSSKSTSTNEAKAKNIASSIKNKDMKLDEDKLTRLNSPRSKEGNQRGEDETKSQSSPANEAKRVEAPSDKSNSPNSNEVVPNQSRESRQGLICPRSQASSSMTVNPWNVKMVKAELEKMRKKDTNNKFKFLLQENAVASFHCPSIIDLKMGIRQYGDDASEEKRKRFMDKTNMSTSAKLGVRLCGLQVYHVPTKKYIYVNKYKGRHLTVDGFKRIVFMFLHNGFRFRFDVVDALLAKLTQLLDIVSKLKSYRFFSSSLLIGYDGRPSSSGCQESSSQYNSFVNEAPSVPEHSYAASHLGSSTLTTNTSPVSGNKEPSKQQQRQALATSSILNQHATDSSFTSNNNCPSSPMPAQEHLPQKSNTASDDSRVTKTATTTITSVENRSKSSSPLVDMKMIDFAHTTTSSFADEIVYEGPDEGYVLGLQNMIYILEELKSLSSEEQQRIAASFYTDSTVFNVNGKT